MKALRKIGRQIGQLRRDLKVAVKEINGQAARKVAQGNYVASQEMVALAKAVQQFGVEAKEFNERWNGIRKQRAESPPVEITPVWEYYPLVARALVSLGGEGRVDDVIDWIKTNTISQLKSGDLLEGAKGEPVWKRSVLKTKRPMTKEGFLESGAGNWKLTKSGRNLASQSN
jgi:hypothetical protein